MEALRYKMHRCGACVVSEQAISAEPHSSVTRNSTRYQYHQKPLATRIPSIDDFTLQIQRQNTVTQRCCRFSQEVVNKHLPICNLKWCQLRRNTKMHFAMPPTARKPSHPSPFPSSRSPMFMLRRRRLQLIAILACGAFAVFMLFSRIFSSSPGRPPPGTPEIVLVTVIDDHGFSKDHIERIKQNRRDYAERHGQ
jgi:hypothetical protein